MCWLRGRRPLWLPCEHEVVGAGVREQVCGVESEDGSWNGREAVAVVGDGWIREVLERGVHRGVAVARTKVCVPLTPEPGTRACLGKGPLQVYPVKDL